MLVQLRQWPRRLVRVLVVEVRPLLGRLTIGLVVLWGLALAAAVRRRLWQWPHCRALSVRE